MTFPDIFVISTARTAIGTFGGALKDVPNTQLATTAVRASRRLARWASGKAASSSRSRSLRSASSSAWSRASACPKTHAACGCR